MAQDYRSEDRSETVPFRMSKADKARLKREAAAAGYSLQQLLESRVLGEAKPRRKPGPQPQAERLNISA